MKENTKRSKKNDMITIDITNISNLSETNSSGDEEADSLSGSSGNISNKEMNSETFMHKKRKRNKSGRKARFLIEQLLYDQRMARMCQEYIYNAHLLSMSNRSIQMEIEKPNLDSNGFQGSFPISMAHLETISDGFIPGSFDFVPRGESKTFE